MGRLYALDAATGALRWRRDIAAGERRAVFAPAWIGEVVVATFTTFDGALAGGLAAFDRRGNRRWTRRFAAGVGAAGPPAAVGSRAVVARTDGGVEVVEAASGRTVWTLAPEPPTRGVAAERDVRALTSVGQQLVVTSFHGPIRAFDARTRRQRWEYSGGPLDAVALRVRGYGDHVYVPYSDGSLVALDGKTGLECWRIGPDAGAYDWPPAVAPGSVLAGGSHALSAFDRDPHEVAAGRSRPPRR
jgi:outer membrane protein assembly factor BamB